MRICAGLIAVLVVFASQALAEDSAFFAASQRLDGEWRGEGYALRVDSYRAQANVDLNRPFDWQRFLVKDVVGDTVTFTIGAELYEATVQPESLTLTSTSFRGPRYLYRQQFTAETRTTNGIGLRR